ncbi:MAG: hypothetical protein Q8N51_12580 [Gammaproteobacteria bacterium]|nr:hypothetical protein [Gammaproteobacteria bacterium]
MRTLALLLILAIIATSRRSRSVLTCTWRTCRCLRGQSQHWLSVIMAAIAHILGK